MSESSIPRRFFVSRLAVGTAALGVAACTSSSSAAAPAPPMDSLETWLATMKGANKCIYDCVGAGGASDGILFARNLLTLSGEKLGTKDSDMSVIVSFRHFATPFGYSDAMWAKYPFSDLLKFDDRSEERRVGKE